jgi:YD repeat-containing protein
LITEAGWRANRPKARAPRKVEAVPAAFSSERQRSQMRDLDGRLQLLVYPTRNQLTYDYTGRGQMKRITEQRLGESQSHMVTEYAYDENGNRKERRLQNGAEADYDYDDANRLLSLVHGENDPHD